MYRCTICNADNKPDYMFNDSKCMDCVTELEWQKEEHKEDIKMNSGIWELDLLHIGLCIGWIML
jgi:hypothetical protein